MISVIIPTLNEAENLPRIVDVIAGDEIKSEIIIVDGGSTDGTPTIARKLGLRLVETIPSRGIQIQAGTEAATGDVFWILHADCHVASGSLSAIERELSVATQSPGGNFRLLFDGDDDFSRWLDGFYARIRSKGIYYGDSGVFVRRTAYEQLGGIKPLFLMEDYDFNRRLERCGPTIMISSPPLVTSSRRFQSRPKWAIITRWLVIHLMFHAGFPSLWLAKLYHSTRH